MTFRPIFLILSALLLAASSGCVQRTITIRSNPPGALVHLNDVEVGRTPVTVPFTFYGAYAVRLRREGYRTIHAVREANPPWWELPGLDLIAALLPWEKRVELVWTFDLRKRRAVHEQQLIERALELREALRPEQSSRSE